MTKKGILWKLVVLFVGIIFVLADRACSVKAEGSSGISDPAHGWTPPDWIDTIGTQTQEPEPSSEPSSDEDPVYLRAHQAARIQFNQANVEYLFQSASNRWLVYLHQNNNGSNDYYNYPPFTFTPSTNLAGTNFTAGRILPNSGHTSYTRSFQLDNEGYVMALYDSPAFGDLETTDTITYSFRSDSSLQLYTDSYLQSTVEIWRQLGYETMMSDFVVTFSTDIVLESLSDGSYTHYLQTDSTTWLLFSGGYNYKIKIPDFDSDNQRVFRLETYIVINPLGSGSSLAQKYLDYCEANSITPVVPHYIFSDGGIWWSRVNESSPQVQSIGLLEKLFNKLFIPSKDNLDRIFAQYTDISVSGPGQFVLGFRDRLYEFIEDGIDNPNLEIDLPGFDIEIAGETYTVWEEYHFDFQNMFFVNGGNGGLELGFTLLQALRFAMDTLIVCSFLNSVFAIVVTLFDLKLWKGSNGEEITDDY